MTEFEKIFNVLKTGSSDEIKETKKAIEKIWNADRKMLKNADEFIFGIIKNFDNIKDGEHKVAVISGMNLFVLDLMDKHFDKFSQFILKNIENSDGRVREASRRLASWFRFKNTLRPISRFI